MEHAPGRVVSAFLLDTCAVVWAILEPSRLSPRAVSALQDPQSAIHLLPISVAEVACAVERGRLELNEHWKPWLRRHVQANGWTYLAIDAAMVEEAYSLPSPFHTDPADRLIVATARLRQLTVITGDSKILDYPHVQTVW
jgi:PIN domain nuclease of toxin-antitoxin system